MAWCLLPQYANEFKKLLKKEGAGFPEKIKSMTSEQRRNYFAEHFDGTSAKQVNALLESKLLLKDWKQGMQTWVKQTAGLKPEVKRDIIDKIGRMKKVLSPQEEKDFMADLVAQKLGTDITVGEAKKIAELSKLVEQQKNQVTTNRETWINYGEAKQNMYDYLDTITPNTKTWRDWAANISGLPQALQTTLDFSFAFRQGWGSMSTREFWNAFVNQFKKRGELGYAFSDTALRKLQSEIIGSPYYDLAKKSGLRLTNMGNKLAIREEGVQFSGLLEKIPVLGKLVKGSNRAFTGMANDIRFNSFINLVEAAKLKGEDVSIGSKAIKELANVVNNFTGSGNIGTNDIYKNTTPVWNNILYSIRKISADLNTFNPMIYFDPRISKTARQAALRRMIGSTSMTVTALALAKTMGAEVELDPRSADFGKIKIGDTRIDMTGGKGTLLVLAARLSPEWLGGGKTKSTTTGKLSSLTSGKFGRDTRGDVLGRWARNKLAPTASLLADYLYGKNSIGEKFNIKKELLDRAHPMVIGDVIDLLNEEDVGQATFMSLLNIFGFGTQTYSSKKEK